MPCVANSAERPRRMAPYKRLDVGQPRAERFNVVDACNIAENDRCIALEATQLRELHRRPFERYSKTLIIHRQNVMRECRRILLPNDVTGAKRLFAQRQRELDIPWTNVLAN